MNITDEKTLKLLKKLDCWDVWDALDMYPDDERDGRSDMQMLADEAGYILSMYEESGTSFYDDLKESKYILNRTKYGKRIPVIVPQMIPIYKPSDIQGAKDTVNEYNRLKRLVKKLKDDGYYSQWY